MKVKTQLLCDFLNETLNPQQFTDYCYNGLQVEGAEQVSKVGIAVDACQQVFTEALRRNCDFLLVHHGLFWGKIQRIHGPLAQALTQLLSNRLNLYAVHLPLDAHPAYGNNAALADMIGLTRRHGFATMQGQAIGIGGELLEPQSVVSIEQTLREALAGPILKLPFGPEQIKRVAIVSGSGSSFLPQAIEQDYQLLISGESSHQDHHIAKEGAINVLYAGHYHTEQGGVQRIGALLKEKFGIPISYIDFPTLT